MSAGRDDFCPERFAAEVFSVARARVGGLGLQPHDADDLLQDVCVTVLRAARRRGADVFAGRSELSTWVYSTMVNALRMRRRTEARTRRLGREEVSLPDAILIGEDVLEFVDPTPSPEDLVAGDQAVARVERIVAEKLSRRQRAVLFASVDVPLAEASAELGMTVGATKSLRHRTLKLLREEMSRGERGRREEAVA